MLRKLVGYFTLPALLLFCAGSEISAAGISANLDTMTGTLEKMVVTGGNVELSVDSQTYRFAADANSMFTVLVFNQALRNAEQGELGLIWGNANTLPGSMNASAQQLVIERLAPDAAYELAIRDAKSGFVFFNVEGNQYDYNASTNSFTMNGRLILSPEFASQLGRSGDKAVGTLAVNANVTPIEITRVVNGAPQESTMVKRGAGPNAVTSVPGPDVIVGDLPSMQQFGSSGTQVGLGVGTTSCNNGNVELNWFALPSIDHPVIPQGLYRMSANGDRFEMIGQSWLKHAFTALQNNACGFGCSPASNGTHLGVGCSDPYGASLNASQTGLGSRAWVNPYTGAYASTASDHNGHNHTGTSHRILVESDDLNTNLNAGATYYAEAQYVTPHEYAWCQTHPSECNMFNNASYRQFSVSGTSSFTFNAVGGTVRMQPAISAWTGASVSTIEPAPGADGRAYLAYKVTGPVGGVYHYEYAINNQNLDRGIQSFMVPLGCGITITNAGFHAPPNHPGFPADGTNGNSGYSNAAWTVNQNANFISWNSPTLAQDANANALRWGTTYNYRFDSTRPPQTMYAIVGFYKSGSPIAVQIQGPTATACNSQPGTRR